MYSKINSNSKIQSKSIKWEHYVTQSTVLSFLFCKVQTQHRTLGFLTSLLDFIGETLQILLKIIQPYKLYKDKLYKEFVVVLEGRKWMNKRLTSDRWI